MIEVINRHHYRGKEIPGPSLYIGRGTPLGNTVSRRGEGTDGEMLARYELWLMDRLTARDPEVLAALNSIGPDHRLVCSCAPAPCHGEVVKRVAEWLHGKGEW